MIFTKDTIQKRQRWALDHPARFIQEFITPGYVLDVEWHGLIVRTVLSIDLFQSPLAWRSQIALMYPNKTPRPLKQYTMAELILCHDIAKSFLEGVGIPQTNFLLRDRVSIEIAKHCTASEAAHAVNASFRPDVDFSPVLVGEFNEYDLSKKTQVDGIWDASQGKEIGLYQPSKRRMIYVQPGTETNN